LRLALCCIGLLWAEAAAAEKGVTEPAECILIVKGVDLIRGPCLTNGIGDGGAFAIASLDGEYAARVRVKAPGVAEAFWKETPFSETSDAPLGAVMLIGACWASDKAKLCVAQ
jgi:hypothetical protein